jgi:hypothetical protein
MTRVTRHKPSPALVTSIVALVVAMGGTSYAAIKLPRNSVGSAQLRRNAVTSAKVRNGSLLRQDFKPGQLPRGPQGLQGPQGPQGPAGPAGANGATHVVFSDSAGTTVAAGADGSDSVACPDASTATGGGVFVTDGAEILNVDAPVTESDSTPGAGNQPNGWEGAIHNASGGDVTLVVEAICASP